MLGKGGRIAVAIMIGAALAGTGYIVGWRFQSPDEAELPEPEPIVLTETVESRDLSVVTTVTGTLQAASTFPVLVSGSGSSDLSIVSGRPVGNGDTLSFCKPIIEISGRPVIALQGEVRMYRDLGPGDEGPDVKQLQESLAACGYTASADGVFGAQTEVALRALYADIDYRHAQRENLNEGAPPSEPEDEDAADDPNESEPAEPAPPKMEAYLPTAEVATISQVGIVADVAAINTTVGEDPVAIVLSEDAAIDVVLTPAQRLQVAQGDAAIITGEGINVESEVPEIPLNPVATDEGEAGFEISFPLTVDQFPTQALGGSVQVAITSGEGTVYDMVVPEIALNVDSDGSYFVTAQKNSDLVDIRVTVVATGGGYCAIEGDLEPGMAIVTGRDEQSDA